ncbi:hypothetical protein Taro_001906, partial [Colocasia esculenta]|nr:hypothetical protein [Colocasia esculenta]
MSPPRHEHHEQAREHKRARGRKKEEEEDDEMSRPQNYAADIRWPYHASKQARMYEHDQVTLIRHVETNVHREKIHQECTPEH